jgi:hypothetical protein
LISDGRRQIEYQLTIQLDPIADKPLENYLANFHFVRQEKLAEISPMVRLGLGGQQIENVMKMRYLANSL